MSDFKQVVLINRDLKMKKGKMVVQGMHGSIIYMDWMSDIECKIVLGKAANIEMSAYDRYLAWMAGGTMKKIVFKVTEREIREFDTELGLKGIWHSTIHDMGLTQVPENSLTGMIVEPLPERTCTELFGDLKLL